MKATNLLMAGVAIAFMAGGVGSAFAQQTTAADTNPHGTKKVAHNRYTIDRPGAANNPSTYRPLTVNPVAAPAAVAGGVVGGAVGAGTGIAADAIGVGTGVVGGTINGVGTLVAAPFNGLSGAAPSISPNAAPPLPIKARYSHTGAVADSIEEGYSQPVPVDKGGPIYMLDKDAPTRSVTPFSLLAFPVTGVTSIITSPLRPAGGA